MNTFRLIRSLLRTMRKANWSFCFRSRYKGVSVCPLTFAASVATATRPDEIHRFKQSADTLGIDVSLAKDIASAADGNIVNDRAKGIRRVLIKAFPERNPTTFYDE